MRYQDPKIRITESGKYYIRPYVDRLSESGELKRERERIYLVATNKRDAVAEKNSIMLKINKGKYVVQSQMKFSDLLDHYLKEYVERGDNLAASTAGKYRAHIKNHIRPALENLMLADVTTLRIDSLLSGLANKGLSWATRLDVRNILCGIFTQAERWGWWKEKNPAIDATVGRQRAKREKKYIKPEQLKELFAELPNDVRMICLMALSCTLRISEVLGLQWKHIDFDKGLVLVRQRWYRGDLDVVKGTRSRRNVPMGNIKNLLAGIVGAPEEFIFHVKSPGGSIIRDDRDIQKFYLRPASKKIGIYHEGFGFHTFRRLAITELSKETDHLQAMKAAGHSKISTTELYTLVDQDRLNAGVAAIQERVM